MKMDWLRTSLIAGIAVTCFLLMIRWTEFQEQKAASYTQEPAVSQQQPLVDSNAIPELRQESTEDLEIPTAPSQAAPVERTAAPNKTVSVHTDLLNIEIDLTGGDIVEATLPAFYRKIDTPDQPFELMKNTRAHTYVMTSGLVGRDGTDKTGSRPVFHAPLSEYRLKDGEDTLNVDLHYQQSDQVRITKRYTFTRDSYLIDIQYLVQNGSDQPWQAVVYGQIKRNDFNPVVTAGIGMQPYLGAATTTDDNNYEKVKFGDLDDKKFDFEKSGGWVAMVQHYFFTALIPSPQELNSYSLFSSNNNYYLRFTTPPLAVMPGAQGEKTFSFYVGPKHIKSLETIAPYLDLTVDYGILWWIAKPLFYALDFIHGFVGNWGVAIILLTVLIKALFFYPSAASYRSMAKMRKVQPKMAELKERYGDNKQKLSSEMMKLYKDEKVNPLGGCLPILIQMPVFIALYWVLMESVELRHAPFFLWIQDLSVKDPYFVLPLIMGATMWIQQKLNPTPPDPMQAKVMQIMPVFFTFLFLVFPAGLVLYWVVNNTLSIIQQYVITRQIEKS